MAIKPWHLLPPYFSDTDVDDDDKNGWGATDSDIDDDSSWDILSSDCEIEDVNDIQESKIEISKSKQHKGTIKDDEGLYDEAMEIIYEQCSLEKLKVDHCKAYLRAHGLRRSGSKAILLARIQEHLELQDGGSQAKYPRSGFSISCKGDVCCGDVILFQQTVYDKFSIVSWRSEAPPLGRRSVAGRVVKENYGDKKQQHTFTIEVLWSSGVRPLTLMSQLLVKGRNLYRHKIFRQPWKDENKRKKVIKEKHKRGDEARRVRAIAKEHSWHRQQVNPISKKRKVGTPSEDNTKRRRQLSNSGLQTDSIKPVFPSLHSDRLNNSGNQWSSDAYVGAHGLTIRNSSPRNSVSRTMSSFATVKVGHAANNHMYNFKPAPIYCSSIDCPQQAPYNCANNMCKPCCAKNGSICGRHGRFDSKTLV